MNTGQTGRPASRYSETNRILPGHRHGKVPSHIIEVALVADWHDAADRSPAIIEHSEVARQKDGDVRLAQYLVRVSKIDFNETDARPVLLVARTEINPVKIALDSLRHWIRRVGARPWQAAIRSIDAAELGPFHNFPFPIMTRRKVALSTSTRSVSPARHTLFSAVSEATNALAPTNVFSASVTLLPMVAPMPRKQ